MQTYEVRIYDDADNLSVTKALEAKSRKDAVRRMARTFGSLGMIAGIDFQSFGRRGHIRADVRGTSGRVIRMRAEKLT